MPMVIAVVIFLSFMAAGTLPKHKFAASFKNPKMRIFHYNGNVGFCQPFFCFSGEMLQNDETALEFTYCSLDFLQKIPKKA
ncbi:hypothetical protein [Ruminococcus sp.]|uniref:hypothetical protein n=1 Tax=Ruminococcus sp. TaxID=41978 RepID=UPI003FD705C3